MFDVSKVDRSRILSRETEREVADKTQTKSNNEWRLLVFKCHFYSKCQVFVGNNHKNHKTPNEWKKNNCTEQCNTKRKKEPTFIVFELKWTMVLRSRMWEMSFCQLLFWPRIEAKIVGKSDATKRFYFGLINTASVFIKTSYSKWRAKVSNCSTLILQFVFKFDVHKNKSKKQKKIGLTLITGILWMAMFILFEWEKSPKMNKFSHFYGRIFKLRIVYAF